MSCSRGNTWLPRLENGDDERYKFKWVKELSNDLYNGSILSITLTLRYL